VLSSTSVPAAWHEDVLRRDGVLELFDARVWSSDLEYTKPHRTAFLAAMAAVGVEDPAPTACTWATGSTDDVSGGQGGGDAGGATSPTSEIPAYQQVPVDVEPDAVVHRLSELPAVLEAWLA